jgi:hypothetical protein
MKDFKKFLNESKDQLDEASYYTLPEKVVGNELFVLQRELSEFYKSVKKGNDVNITELKKMKGMMDKIVSSVEEKK